MVGYRWNDIQLRFALQTLDFACSWFYRRGVQISLVLPSLQNLTGDVNVNLQLPHWFCAIVFEPAFFIKLSALEHSFSKEYRHGTWFKECIFIWQVSLKRKSYSSSGYLENVLTYAHEMEIAKLAVLLLSPSPSIRGAPASLARGEGVFILSCDFRGPSKKSFCIGCTVMNSGEETRKK